jgi:hypothetical protein
MNQQQVGKYRVECIDGEGRVGVRVNEILHGFGWDEAHEREKMKRVDSAEPFDQKISIISKADAMCELAPIYIANHKSAQDKKEVDPEITFRKEGRTGIEINSRAELLPQMKHDDKQRRDPA